MALAVQLLSRSLSKVSVSLHAVYYNVFSTIMVARYVFVTF